MFLLGVGRLSDSANSYIIKSRGLVYLYNSSVGPMYYDVVVGTALL